MHARRRLRERYGSGHTTDLRAMEKRIIESKGIPSEDVIMLRERAAGGRSIFRVRHNFRWVSVVFNNKTQHIVTVLPDCEPDSTPPQTKERRRE